MAGGKHASEEEFEFHFDFEWEKIRNILLIVIILAVIVGVVWGIYHLVDKMQGTKTEKTSAGINVLEEPEYHVLGKLLIPKIEVEQPILDSSEEEALEKGVIKLYGDTLNKERKFLHSRS